MKERGLLDGGGRKEGVRTVAAGNWSNLLQKIYTGHSEYSKMKAMMY